ncbi:7 transmembrane receptor [Dictyocaulus viviparus]|uniref:7 transmembrane receptor n=1 Tax=Dictyocaulus viviparus TaxID=29172 RepID=A0A0D8Y1I3_DICVI|nr:7 transmembrane receptor [Dictyocaulus viviparus]
MELYAAVDFAYPYKFPEWICKIRAYLIEFTSYASILKIASLKDQRSMARNQSPFKDQSSKINVKKLVEHYLKPYPIRSQSSPKISRAYMTIIIMWIISSIAAIPIGFIVKINRLPLPEWAIEQEWTHKVSDDLDTIKNTDFCAMDVEKPNLQSHIISFAFIAFFMIPAILITLMYTHIACRIVFTDSLLYGVENNKVRAKATNTVIKMLVSVVISFFLCWLPFHIQRLLSVFISYHDGDVSPAIETVFQLVFYISGCFYYSNSAINPILYNVFSEKYRRAFCTTILGRKIAKRIRPQWYMAKSGALLCTPQASCRRSNVEYSINASRHTGTSTKLLRHPKESYNKSNSDFKTAAILI